MARLRHTVYPSITYSVHGRLYHARAGILEVPDTDQEALAFFRQHSDAQHGILIELPPHPDPATACPQCRAQFPTLDALRSHIQHDQGTPFRSQRAELQTLASAQARPSKAAGAQGLEPWATCDYCGRQYRPRALNQRFCSMRHRGAHLSNSSG